MPSIGSALAQTLDHVSEQTGLKFDHQAVRSVAGGDINKAYRVKTTDGEHYFLKLNKPSTAAMFAAEHTGLQALAAAEKLRVPTTVATGASDSHAWLLIEWLDMAPGNTNAARHLGRSLAGLHQVRAELYGFEIDNTIGRTLQRNDWNTDWVTFYRDCRLVPQLELAVDNGAPPRTRTAMERLLKRVDDWFTDYTPASSLLHGDLWGGNWAMLSNGQPVVFDPAAYYGDREADVAMTHLFGGFPPEFYVAYEGVWPLDAGAGKRLPLYNLYHVLNHFNLFGGSYLSQADRMIAELLAT